MYWLPRENVLVPTDFSDASVDAMHTALAMVESAQCVHVLHVVEPIPKDLIDVELPPGFDVEQSEEARRCEWSQRLATFINDHDLKGLTSDALTGEPSRCITRYASDHNIDLIVIAAHGYDRGERITMGSVTERVLHSADCPVLVLRPDGRIASNRSRVGVRQSNGYSPAGNASHAKDSPARS